MVVKKEVGIYPGGQESGGTFVVLTRTVQEGKLGSLFSFFLRCKSREIGVRWSVGWLVGRPSVRPL